MTPSLSEDISCVPNSGASPDQQVSSATGSRAPGAQRRAVDLVNEAKADVEALIEGRSTSEAIIAGRASRLRQHGSGSGGRSCMTLPARPADATASIRSSRHVGRGVEVRVA